MTDVPITSIATIKDVELFFEYLVAVEHVNPHPDTAFSDYLDDNGTPVLSAEKECRYADLMKQAFCVCEHTGIDIYIVAEVIRLEYLHSE